MRIYLDYSASTPVAPEVFEAMKPYFSEKFGNASSLHSFGREAEIAVDESREILSRFFDVDFGEVYFTSGATEANNWIVSNVKCQMSNVKTKPHVITSAFEHESLLEPIRRLEKEGLIEVTYVMPSRQGFISPKDIEAALKENTVLVSIMYVNNEIGTIQPIKEIGKIIEKFRENQNSKTKNQKHIYPLFHTDAVQAIQFLEPRLDYLKVDAMTVSSHKIYGPKGVGALIAKKRVPLGPLLYGGGQEFEKRSGTENVPAIVGFAKAIEIVHASSLMPQVSKRLEGLKEELRNGILKIVPNVQIVGDAKPSTPHILNAIFPDIESQFLVIALDQEGVAVSSGSACSAKAIKPSGVLLALGYSQEEAFSSVRFSLGRYTQSEEIKKTIEALSKVIKKLSKS